MEDNYSGNIFGRKHMYNFELPIRSSEAIRECIILTLLFTINMERNLYIVGEETSMLRTYPNKVLID